MNNSDLHSLLFYYIQDLILFALCPLSLNRFVHLYFPYTYEKIFNKVTIVIFLIFYDIINVLIDHFTHDLDFWNNNLYIIIFCINLVLSICLYLKIQKSINLLEQHNGQESTIKEIRMAVLG